MFAATWVNASSRRSITSSIVAGPACLALLFGFDAVRGFRPDRSLRSSRPTPRSTRGFSVVPKFSSSCRSSPLTGIAFPPPWCSSPRVWVEFPRPSGTVRSSDFCWVIGFRLSVLRPTVAATGPSRPHWVRPGDFVIVSSPIRPGTNGNWATGAVRHLARPIRLTALRFRSKRSRTYGFHRTVPRGHGTSG